MQVPEPFCRAGTEISHFAYDARRLARLSSCPVVDHLLSRRRVSGAFRSSIRLVSDADSKPLGAPVGRSFRNLGYQTFQVARTFVVAAETGSLFLECLDIDSAGPLTEMTWPVWRSPRQSGISSRSSDDACASTARSAPTEERGRKEARLRRGL